MGTLRRAAERCGRVDPASYSGDPGFESLNSEIDHHSLPQSLHPNAGIVP
jgi:hypothetical protein